MRTYPTIPLNKQQGTIHSVSAASGIPKSMLHRKVKEGAIHEHLNAVKPYMTEDIMRIHVAFCLNHIDVVHQKFHDMMDVVHIDEKWFYLFEMEQKYYLGEGEWKPYYWRDKSKWFIMKVMFLSAVACPHYDPH